MSDGKFFNWLLSNVLPKVIEIGVDYHRKKLCILEIVVFFSCSDLLTKPYFPRSNAFFSVMNKETYGSITNYNLVQN